MRRLTSTFTSLASVLILLSGCGGPAELVPLMPTPAVYSETALDLLAEVPEDKQWVPRRVYYATTRQRTPELRAITYGNDVSDQVSCTKNDHLS